MIKSIIKKNHCKNKISNGKKNVSFRRFVSDKYIYTVNDSNEDTFICNGNKNDECDISTYLDERKLEDIDEVLMVDLQMLNDPLIEDIVETFIISKTLIKKVLAFNFHGNIKNSRYALSEENLKNIAEKLKYSKRKAFKEVEITLCMILKHHIVNFYNTPNNTVLLHSVENEFSEILQYPLKFSTRMLLITILIFMSAHPETEKHYTIKLKELKNQLQYNVIMLHYVPIEKIVINEYISVYEEYDFRFMVLNFLDYFSSIVKMEDLKWTEYSSDAYLVFFDDTVSEFTNLIKSLIKCPTNKNSFLKMKTIEFGLVINYSATYLSFLNDYGFFKDKLDKCTGFYVLENIARTTISLFINENSKDILKNDSICYKLKCVFFTICSVGISICKIAMKYPNFKRFLFQLQCWLKIITFLNNIENIKNETVSDDNIKKYQENIRQEKIIGKSLYRKFIKKIKKTK